MIPKPAQTKITVDTDAGKPTNGNTTTTPAKIVTILFLDIYIL